MDKANEELNQEKEKANEFEKQLEEAHAHLAALEKKMLRRRGAGSWRCSSIIITKQCGRMINDVKHVKFSKQLT